MNPISVSSMVLALQAAGNGGILGTLTGLAPMLLIFVIFYVVLMLPMQRHRKGFPPMVQGGEEQRGRQGGGGDGGGRVDGDAAHRRQRPREDRQVGDLRPRGRPERERQQRESIVMNRNLLWRGLLILAVAVICVVLAYPPK